MRKVTLCIPALFFATFFCHAQVKLGLRAGGNLAHLTGITNISKNRLGWYGGFTAQVPFTQKWFLQPELIYSSKGYRPRRYSITEYYSENKFEYLNVPILASYYFDKKTAVVFGPEFGYLLQIVEKLNNGEVFRGTENVRSGIDVAASLGVQTQVFKRFGIEVRYNYGFGSLRFFDAVGTPFNPDKKGAHRVFQAGLKYNLSY